MLALADTPVGILMVMEPAFHQQQLVKKKTKLKVQQAQK